MIGIGRTRHRSRLALTPTRCAAASLLPAAQRSTGAGTPGAVTDPLLNARLRDAIGLGWSSTDGAIHSKRYRRLSASDGA